jgi:hypothetical protein
LDIKRVELVTKGNRTVTLLRYRIKGGWPTAATADGNGGAGGLAKRQGGDNLRTAVREWPTPEARDDRSSAHSEATAAKHSRPLNERARYESGKQGELNPDWVEALLGFPNGWTDLTRSMSIQQPGYNPAGLNLLSLYSGIGGVELGAHRAGVNTIALCDSERYCQELLKQRFPGLPVFNQRRGG